MIENKSNNWNITKEFSEQCKIDHCSMGLDYWIEITLPCGYSMQHKYRQIMFPIEFYIYKTIQNKIIQNEK